MKNKVVIIFIICFLPLSIFGTQEKSSFKSLQNAISNLGPTGLINIPSAKALDNNEFNLGLHSNYVLKLNYGLSFFLPVELGLRIEMKEQFTFQEIFDSILFDVKCEFISLQNLKTAVGIFNNKPYFVLSNHFNQIGIYVGTGINEKILFSNKNIEALHGLFAGITKTFDSSAILIGEYDGSSANVGFRFLLSSSWKIDVFITEILSNNKLNYNNILLGINYCN